MSASDEQTYPDPVATGRRPRRRDRKRSPGPTVAAEQTRWLDALGEGVLALDSTGSLMEANAAAASILGFETPGCWEPLITHRGGADGRAATAIVLETGAAVRNVEVHVDAPDGTRVALSVDYLPVRNDGTMRGVLIVFRNATAAVRELSVLASSHERMREAHDVTGLTSWEWRPDTDQFEVFGAGSDPAAGSAQRIGTLRERLAHRCAADGVEARELLATFVSGACDASVRLHRWTLGDRQAWIETRTRAVRDPDGALLCVRGTSQDVTEREASRRELEAGRDFLQATLDSFPAHVAVLDADGTLMTTNRAWKAFAAANGGASSAAGGNYFEACANAGDDEHALRAATGLRAVATGERELFTFEYPCHGDGVERWFLLRASRYQGSGPARLVVAHEDVTERHHADEQMRLKRAILDEVNVSVIATDLERTVTYWNRAAEDLYGWTREEAVGRLVADLIVPASTGPPERVRAALEAVRQWEGECVLSRKDGSAFPAEVRNRVAVDGAGEPIGWIGVAVDVTERVASEKTLQEARDYMRAVADCMGQGLLTLDAQGSVIYVNPAAETLLGCSGDRLLGRSMADFVVGSDEGGPDPTSAHEVLRGAVAGGATVRGEDVLLLRSDGMPFPAAYTAAPIETVTGVQGHVVVFEDISERKAYEDGLRRDVEKLAWIGRVQDALAEDRFVLYAQPIIDLHTREVVKHELLLRLRDVDGAIIGPLEFLPVAEKYGLIGAIDRWVIEQAVAIAATGSAVEVNVSARSVCDPAIVEHIERCLRTAGAEPGLIGFEITETALVEDEAAALAFAQRVHALGSKIALDDFGTGYGTFTYLKQLPIDFLKIDREFVRDLSTNRASHHVVQAVVALAHAFGLQTVAEGVEDRATLALLGDMGVDLAQGYFIARPGPVESEIAATRRRA